MTDRAILFERHRARLRGVAYRMLGSLGDAEDVVQDAYLRWHRAELEQIGSAEAWLTTTTARLAIDRLRALAAERRAYMGPWLPEPWLGDGAQQGQPAGEVAPDHRLERAADLSMAFLVLLQRLSPDERAAFLLHDVFEVDYPDIAATLEKSEAACRQLVRRARSRVREGRSRFEATEEACRRLLARFLEATRTGDRARLLALFAPDATLLSDGGGKVRAARNVIRGADRVARFLLGVTRKQSPRLEVQMATINGEPGLLRRIDGGAHSTMSFATDGHRILEVYFVLNPDKLSHLQAPAPAMIDTSSLSQRAWLARL
jgi:RNA polymerase sigma-70 factor, ECF subfamily